MRTYPTIEIVSNRMYFMHEVVLLCWRTENTW